MKVSLSIEFDLDEELKKFSDAELREAFWKELLHYAICRHLEDRLKWQVKVKDEEKDSSAQLIADTHKVWSERLQTGKIIKFKVKR